MKANDVAVDGDVGQLVAGNVVHEGATAASHLHNVITIQGAAKPAPVPTITELQRKRIAVKVKEVMGVAGIKQQLEVYSVVMTDFGVEKIMDLPRDQFKGVMAMLDNWIAEEAQEQPPQRTPEQRESGDESSASPTALPGRVGLIRWGLAFLAAVCVLTFCAYVIIQNLAPAARNGSECQHDGKAYSLGSVIRMPDNGIYECAAGEPGGQAAWRTSSLAAGKRR